MLKMFSTQLSGLFIRIHEKQEENFEDAARLLAQGPAGAGRIFIYGIKEMEAVALEAVYGEEPMKAAIHWNGSVIADLTNSDRALIISRLSTDAEAISAANYLQKENIPFAAVSTDLGEPVPQSLALLADIHINLFLKKGLLPDETGGRFGYPAPIAALFAYYGIRFIIEEILADYED